MANEANFHISFLCADRPLPDFSKETGEAHSNDERLTEASLYKLVEFLWYAALEAAT